MLRDSGGRRWEPGSAIRKHGRTLAFENCGLSMHTSTVIRTVQSTSLKPAGLQRGCPMNNLSREMSPPMRDSVNGRRLSFLARSRPVEIMIMRFTKHKKNGTERELLAFL